MGDGLLRKKKKNERFSEEEEKRKEKGVESNKEVERKKRGGLGKKSRTQSSSVMIRMKLPSQDLPEREPKDGNRTDRTSVRGIGGVFVGWCVSVKKNDEGGKAGL